MILRSFFKTAKKVSSIFIENSDGHYLYNNNELLDCSPYILCLTKIFEKEINYSIINKIRHELGVQMPEYYNKYQSGINAKIPTRNKIIDLNREDEGRLKSIEIGVSKIVFDIYIKLNNQFHIWNKKNAKRILERWEK